MTEKVIREKPDSKFCYYLGSSFSDNTIFCPDLNKESHMHPLCKKYDDLLTWNTSGRVLKCASCLQEEK